MTNNLKPLDYSVFVLVGVTPDDKMKVISYTNWTPKQDEVEKMIEAANGAYKGFLLLSPVNIIDKPNINLSALEIGTDYDIALYTQTQNGVKITYEGDYSLKDTKKVFYDEANTGRIFTTKSLDFDVEFSMIVPGYNYVESTVSAFEPSVNNSTDNTTCKVGQIGGCNRLSK